MQYVVQAPSFVRGRSGVEPTFDLTIRKLTEGNGQAIEKEYLLEVLASNKPIELEEITKEYGKISDVDYSAIVLAVPNLTERARNYPTTYRITVYEGKDIEEALVNADRMVVPNEMGGVQSSRATFVR